MFDLHTDLNKFYDLHVRLGDERAILAEHRDQNLDRLQEGLDRLDYPSTFAHMDQGSYAMHTINQQVNKDYDLDEAIIFDKDDLPSNALTARKRIEEAMKEGGGNFRRPPEAMTNAVRVYYAEGHHIDLAIFRRYIDDTGTVVYEHAGSDWSTRNPAAITEWFSDVVNRLSPSKDFGATVRKGQMRRIVRLVKRFAKSRDAWNLPCGLVISVLVAECYRPNYSRDDVSLHDTLVSIRNRLVINEEVRNPVASDQILTARLKDQTRIKNFREKLDIAIEKLEILQSNTCDEKQAKEAWFWVFQHKFWTTSEDAETFDEQGKNLAAALKTGSVFVSQNGNLHLAKLPEHSYPIPEQRFYGEDQ